MLTRRGSTSKRPWTGSRATMTRSAICSSTTWRRQDSWAADWIRPCSCRPDGERTPPKGHWARARMAEKRKEFDTAEEHLRRPWTGPAASRPPDRSGPVPGQAGPLQESEQNFREAEKLAPNAPQSDVRARRHLRRARPQHRDRAQAAEAISGAPLTPDDPPRPRPKNC